MTQLATTLILHFALHTASAYRSRRIQAFLPEFDDVDASRRDDPAPLRQNATKLMVPRQGSALIRTWYATQEYDEFWNVARTTDFFIPSNDTDQLATQWDRFASISAMCLDFNKILRAARKEDHQIVVSPAHADSEVRRIFHGIQAGILEDQAKGVGPNRVAQAKLFENLVYMKQLQMVATVTRPMELRKISGLLKYELGRPGYTDKDAFSRMIDGNGSHPLVEAVSAYERIPGGFVAYHAEKREAVVVVQGSYYGNTDSITNSEIWTVSIGEVVDYYYEHVLHKSPPVVTPTLSKLRTLLVHRGWGWLALDLYWQVKRIIDTMFSTIDTPLESIVITGHSLGSSIGAQLVLLLHYFMGAGDIPIVRISGLLFAQPRSIWRFHRLPEDFKPVLNKEVLDVVHTNDPVYLFTRLLFRTVGVKVDFERESKYLDGHLHLFGSVSKYIDSHLQDMYKGYIFDQFIYWAELQGVLH